MRSSRGEAGFTLVELMIVVLIIAILIAIAIPTFLGARRKSQDSLAKSHLRGGLLTEKTYYADAFAYVDDAGPGLAALNAIEGNYDWGNPDSHSRGVVVEDVSPDPGGVGQGVVLHSLSRSGTLFCIADTALPFAYSYTGLSGVGTFYKKIDGAGAPYQCGSGGWQQTVSGWS